MFEPIKGMIVFVSIILCSSSAAKCLGGAPLPNVVDNMGTTDPKMLMPWPFRQRAYPLSFFKFEKERPSRRTMGVVFLSYSNVPILIGGAP